ncbi:DUF4113 domain-containing protein [Cronobacter malonaticus]|uniref:DUF4113 domain-containing protein n=1 Tax=Cronobacter malonaticus TaxID=413503 RepID=UPI002A24AF36|nr:DUF4113 domain-containing protein [Cronobacter malonaticus]
MIIYIAEQGILQYWQMKQEMLSPCFTRRGLKMCRLYELIPEKAVPLWCRKCVVTGRQDQFQNYK